MSGGRGLGRVRSALGSLILTLAVTGCGHLVVLHDPLTPPEHNDLGVAYLARGDTVAAEREFRVASRRDPRLAVAWLNAGNVAAGRGRWKTAAGRYRRALVVDPGSADAMNNLAWTLLHIPSAGLEESERLARAAVARGGGRDSIYRTTLEEVVAERARRAATGAR